MACLQILGIKEQKKGNIERVTKKKGVKNKAVLFPTGHKQRKIFGSRGF